jgi:UDP:flavonoid glycosyltransferase YjiC (YdhE family)
VPPNAEVTGLLRHSALLPHADLVVTHAGLGTVTAALAFGVPMVCLPLGRDQFNNARLVEEIGAGVALDNEAEPGAIAAAVTRLLSAGAPERRVVSALSEQIAAQSKVGGTMEMLAP